MVPSRFTVEQGHVLMFGRAVGDTLPGRTDLAALDPHAPVPPTFVAASALHDPEHMRGLRPTGPLAAQAGDGGGGAVLHAEQHFEYHAAVRVGDVLTVERTDGRTWEKESRHGGRLRFREILTDYRRPDGALSVQARMLLVQVASRHEGPPPTEASARDGGPR
jgi:acyl-CoA thioesterase FadM